MSRWGILLILVLCCGSSTLRAQESEDEQENAIQSQNPEVESGAEQDIEEEEQEEEPEAVSDPKPPASHTLGPSAASRQTPEAEPGNPYFHPEGRCSTQICFLEFSVSFLTAIQARAGQSFTFGGAWVPTIPLHASWRLKPAFELMGFNYQNSSKLAWVGTGTLGVAYTDAELAPIFVEAGGGAGFWVGEGSFGALNLKIGVQDLFEFGPFDRVELGYSHWLIAGRPTNVFRISFGLSFGSGEGEVAK